MSKKTPFEAAGRTPRAERANDISVFETVRQDIHYSLRALVNHPIFAVVAIVSLALGIGANTAIFELLDAVRLRSLPVTNPQQLVEIKIAGGNHGLGVNTGKYPELTRPIWEELKRNHEPFSGLFAWQSYGANVGRGSETRWRNAIWVSGDFFRVLGIRPWRGRLIGPEDEGACPETTTVASYTFWQDHMGGREPGPGATILVTGEPKQVIGVTPPEFSGLAVGENFDLAFPLCRPTETRRDLFDVAVMGRLRPGWTVERASAWLQSASTGIIEATTPTGRSAQDVALYRRFRLAAYPASNGVSVLREQYSTSLYLLLGITGFVLLIACSNLANLLLARATVRSREAALRLSLGASRARLVRQFLTESLLLAASGAIIGIAIAQVLSRVLLAALSTDTSSTRLSLHTDWRVLVFTVALTALTCIFFGIVPAVRATRTEPATAMRAGGRSMTASRESFSLQRLLVVTQIAVSVVLLVAAFLFVRSFRNLMTFNPGMREEGVTFAVLAPLRESDVPASRYEELRRELLDDVRSIPGIDGAATTTNLPLVGGSWEHLIHVGNAEATSKFTWVSPGYFQTMEVRLLRGRDFNQNDTASSQRVAVVNQTFVRELLGDADPIGRSLRTEAEPDYPSTVYQIVGVIPDTQYNSIRGEVPPMAFAPAAQYPAPKPWTMMVIHSSAPSTTVIHEVKAKLGETHPEIVAAAGDLQEWIRNGLVRERLLATLSGFFGALAALLAIIGLYGVISYMMARRRTEIGIRMALGAVSADVLRMVLRETCWLVIAGIAIGTGFALVAGQWANSLLFHLNGHDPVTLAMAAALLFVIALVASFLPAWRASRVDPMLVLRYE